MKGRQDDIVEADTISPIIVTVASQESDSLRSLHAKNNALNLGNKSIVNECNSVTNSRGRHSPNKLPSRIGVVVFPDSMCNLGGPRTVTPALGGRLVCHNKG